jgi:hypothetical protein
MNEGARSLRMHRMSSMLHPARSQIALKIRAYVSKYSSRSDSTSSPNAALVQIHSPTMLGHTSAIASLIRQPMCAPRYMKRENGWTGIPARSSVGFRSAS